MPQETRFFHRTTLLLALLALAGFAPTFYLRPLFAPEGKFTLLMLAHGLAYTAWVVLLVAQTSLIKAGNIVWHRRLGYSSIVVVVAMMALSAALALVRTRQWLDDPQFDAADVLAFLLTPTTTILYFSGMYIAAIVLRQRPAVHKRLMLIASLDIFTPAVSRLPYLSTLSTTWHYLSIDLLLVALAVHDWRTLRRLHPATVCGGIVLVASQLGRELLAFTSSWIDIAVWLTE